MGAPTASAADTMRFRGTRTRGPVGLAAEKLKEALRARLEPGNKESVLNTNLLRAIGMVHTFLGSGCEDPASLAALQEEVRRALADTTLHMTQTQRFASVGRMHKAGMVRSATAAEGHRKSLDADVAAASPRNHSKDDIDLPTFQAMMMYGPRFNRSTSLRSVDYSLPQWLLGSKAFAMGRGDYGQLAKSQDALGLRAKAWQKGQALARQGQFRATLDAQMKEVEAGRAAEAAAKRAEQMAMDQALKQYEADELARLTAKAEAGVATRRMYAGQVEEVVSRRKAEADNAMREAMLERMQAEQELRREREAKAARVLANQKAGAEFKTWLAAEAASKAQELLQQQEEEKRMAVEAVKVMEERERVRLLALRKIQEKQRLAFERGGGHALQASLEEKARLAAEKAARDAAAYEAEVQARLREKEARQRQVKQELVETLDRQMQDRADALAAEARQKRADKEAMDAEIAAEKARKKAEKEARKAAGREAHAAHQRAMLLEHQKRFMEREDGMTEADRRVHMPVLTLRHRGFANLGVPVQSLPAITAGMQGYQTLLAAGAGAQ